MTETPLQKTAITLCGSLRTGSINEVLRKHLSGKLREAGVDVTDLDLRDFDMPIFNQDIEDAGNTPEAAHRLADLFRSKDVVLIALTGYGGPTDLTSAREAGFDHHICKPAELSRILDLLDQTRAEKR